MKNSKFLILDIESFSEYFCVVIRDLKTKENVHFQISKYHNDLKHLKDYFDKNIKENKLYVITFNGNNYDNIIINYLLLNINKVFNNISKLNHCFLKNVQGQKLYDGLEIAKDINILSNILINSNKKDSRIDKESSYYKYLFSFKYLSIDLQRFWTKMTVKNKKLSLKFFAVSFDLNVLECPIKWDRKDLTEDECKTILEYCYNDVNVTLTLTNYLKPKINFRIKLRNTERMECLSYDDVKIGTESLIKSVMLKNNIEDRNYLKNLSTHRNSVALKDIINKDIIFITPKNNEYYKEYKKDKGKIVITHCFTTFTDMLDFIKTLVVYDTKSINIRVTFKGVIYDIKSGGLHSFHPKKEVIVRQEDYIYEDEDVSSYYPTLGAEFSYIPEKYIPLKLDEILKKDKEERVIDKKEGRLDEAEIKKLKLNGGFYGNTNNIYSPFYDWKSTLMITINGQLMLLKNVEMQTENENIKVDMCNTDGITYMIHKDSYDYFLETNKKWEKIAKSQLEYVKYELVVRNSVNHYFAFYYDKKGELKIKEKGFYSTQPDITSSKSFLIIPKAIIEYFKQKHFYNNIINIEDFVRNHENIYDFCSSVKVDKSYDVYFKGEEVQKLNRYYVSKDGSYLFKKRKGGNLNAIIRDTKLNLLNEFTEIKNNPSNPFSIDYHYYINKIKEMIDELEGKENSKINKQLELF